MLSAVEYCHALLRARILPADLVVDATAGNGHDTLFLAQLVGAEGKVYSFDVQPQAITATRRLLQSEGVPEKCYEVLEVSHAKLAEHLPARSAGHVAAVVFNLGWLPGGDKSVSTQAETTLTAVRTAMDFLQPGGLLGLVLYPGHPSGAEEARVLQDFASGLSARDWQVTEYRTLNALKPPPSVLAIEKAPPKSRSKMQPDLAEGIS